MFSLNRMLSVCFLAVTIVSATVAQEGANRIVQGSSVTITATAVGDRVRITAPSSVVELHVAVYAVSGEKVFDQKIKGGNVFDWHLQDGQAQRLAPGTYVCVVTAKGISGKLTQRIGTVNVEEKSVSVQVADSRQLSAAQAQPIGPVEENSSWTIAGNDEPQTGTVIANDGTDGQMIRGRGALTFRIGNFFSGLDTEQMRLTEAGNLGIGTSEPKAKLDVAGTIRAERFLVVKPGQTSIAAGGQTTDDAGSVQPLVAGTGTQNQIAKWIDNSATLGNSGITETATGVGIATAAPTQALDVNGRIVTTGNKTLAVSSDSMLEVKTTITNNGLAQSAIKARNIFNGSGDFVTGIDAAPTFAPSASINTAQGFVAAASFAPPPGVTITNALGGASATVYSNSSGAVTNGVAFNVVSPFVQGSLKPTNQFGLRINNQGIAGTPTSYGLFVDPQSGSTNSFSAIFAGGKVGIGTTVPEVQLDVKKQNPSEDVALQVTSIGSDNIILGRAANGSQIAPTATVSGQSLMFLGGGGHNGTGFTREKAGIDFQASQNWTAGANGTRIRFITANNDSIGTSERMRIEPDGDIGIGTTAPLSKLHVVTSAAGPIPNANAIATFEKAGRGYLQLLTPNTAESGVLFGNTIGGVIYNNPATPNGLQFRTSVNQTRMVVDSIGNVGIGTDAPSNRLDVRADNDAGRVAIITNEARSDDADCLKLVLDSFPSILLTRTNNFITFSQGGFNNVGAIQGNDFGGIELVSGSADYAEWLPRINPAEQILPGEIVGLHDGRVTKKTRGAAQVMAVSTGSIVAGNDPGEKARESSELVAFIGQVMVRVRGTVKSGDFIVASGLDDGTGIAVSPERITTEQFDQVVGQAWEASTDPGVKSVRVAVGLNRRDPAVGRLVEYSRKQTARIAALEARLTAFEARLESKATTRNLKANHRRKSSDRPRRNQFFKDRSQLK